MLQWKYFYRNIHNSVNILLVCVRLTVFVYNIANFPVHSKSGIRFKYFILIDKEKKEAFWKYANHLTMNVWKILQNTVVNIYTN